jgi:uncharacterized membrane protein
VDHEVSAVIDARPQEVWKIWMDVERRWPEWIPSIARVKRLDTGPLQVGSRTLIKAPKLPPVVWQVTELEPERSFSWATRRWGVTTLTDHRIVPEDGEDAVTVTLQIRLTGPLAWLFAPVASGLVRRSVEAEAYGLKRRCEG